MRHVPWGAVKSGCSGLAGGLRLATGRIGANELGSWHTRPLGLLGASPASELSRSHCLARHMARAQSGVCSARL